MARRARSHASSSAGPTSFVETVASGLVALGYAPEAGEDGALRSDRRRVMDALDGNAIGGLLLDVFGVEMTTASRSLREAVARRDGWPSSWHTCRRRALSLDVGTAAVCSWCSSRSEALRASTYAASPSSSPHLAGYRAAAPRRADQGRDAGQRITLVAAILGSAIATIDGTVVNVALPAIEQRSRRRAVRAAVGVERLPARARLADPDRRVARGHLRRAPRLRARHGGVRRVLDRVRG